MRGRERREQYGNNWEEEDVLYQLSANDDDRVIVPQGKPNITNAECFAGIFSL